MKKINTVHITITAVLVHLMCFTVVLSHIHAKDAASLMNQQSTYAKASLTDITAKAISDLHHHIDKTSLKHATESAQLAARTRQLQPTVDDIEDVSLLDTVHDFMLRLRLVSSLCFQYAF